MNELLNTVLELSWQAALIALAVMAVRALLRRRASRRAICMLWALVALRLLLPARLTVESPVSLQPEEPPVTRVYHDLLRQQEDYYAAPPAQRAEADVPLPAPEKTFALLDQLPAVWLTGVGGMLLYMAVSLLRLRWRLRRARRVEGSVYRCDQWSTPFVLGVLAPRIYVPETVSEQDFPQVLAHERCHIRRGDHVWKPLAFLLLSLHWFNPVLWAAYVLLGRDMESACDEMVLKNATPSQRAAYSRALVACAAQPRMTAVCPLAFGEVAVKERVKTVLQNRKPAVWAAIMLVIAAAIIAVCLLTKPAEKDAGIPDAETLYALRTEYVGDNAAVSGILDALGFREAGAAGEGAPFDYSFEIGTENDAYGVVVRYGHDALPQRTAEWNRQMAQRGYIALALIDNAEWLRWEDVAGEGETPVSGTVYAGDYVLDDYNAVRGSAAGLQALMDVLQARLEDGSIVYYPGDALPEFTEITPWPMLDETGVVSAKAGDYGIVYDAARLPDWETVPLSYLCAYYLNGDGAYAEGAMDTLAKRYLQAPHTVRDYWERLRAVDADAAVRLEEEISAQSADTTTSQPAARQTTLTFNDNGAGLVSYPAAWYSGSGYDICILTDGWHRLTPMDGWNDATVDGSLVLNGKPVEVWESTEDITARLYVAHLGTMTLREAQDWAVGAAGSDFTLTESKQGDMSGTDSAGNQYWTAAFPGADTERFAVVYTVPMSQWEHLGYALSAMADTFTLQ